MKKAIIKLISFAVLAAAVLSLAACRPEPKVTYDENGVGYGESKKWSNVYGLKFDASEESAKITISNEYNGKPVLCIGDEHHNCRFIAYGDGVVDNLRLKSEDADETRIFELTLDIGKIIDISLSTFTMDTYFFKRSEDGKLILYKIHIYWICSEDNKRYIAENGYLYYRSKYEKGNAVPLFDQYLQKIE